MTAKKQDGMRKHLGIICWVCFWIGLIIQAVGFGCVGDIAQPMIGIVLFAIGMPMWMIGIVGCFKYGI